MNIDKFTITSYDQFTGFDRTTGNLEMILDELTDCTIGHTQDSTDITGKGGRRISTLKKNKAVTVTGTNGMLSGGALAAMIGSDMPEDGTFNVHWTDAVTVTGDKATTTMKAVGTAGMEIGTIYVRDENNAYISGGKKYTQVASTPATGQFSYDPDTKEISFFAGDIADGVEVIAFYDAEVEGKRLTNDANHYSKVLAGYMDITCQDGCDNIFHGQFIFKRADFSGNFDLNGASDPATQGFEFTSLPDLCTGETKLWDFILFDK